jgi:hypothetical protein
MNKPLNILKVKDKAETYYNAKSDSPLSSLPARIICVGKSQLSGKTNMLVNLLLNPDKRFYSDDFKGENIILISGSAHNDKKLQTLIDEKEIEHVFTDFDEEQVEALYDMITEEYEEAVSKGKKPEDFLLILDDMSFSGVFKGKDFSIIKKVFSNGRHINLSCIITAQKYTDISTSIRENITMGLFFNCSDKQLDVINEDVNYITTKKEFKKAFRDTTIKKHSFFVVNFTNDHETMYMNSQFQPIDFKTEVPKPIPTSHQADGLNKETSTSSSENLLTEANVSAKL